MYVFYRRSLYGIAKEAGVGCSTVVNACDNFVQYGTPKKPKAGCGRRRREIPPNIFEWLTTDVGL